jgi:acylphosphatase
MDNRSANLTTQQHYIVHGKVQRVFYRQSTAKKAIQLGLTGWVRNLPDGTVEVWAAGDVQQLQLLESWLHEGPPAAKVTQVMKTDLIDKEIYQGFFVR